MPLIVKGSLACGHQPAAGAEQVDEHDMVLFGGGGQGGGVQRDPLVVLLAVGTSCGF